MPDGWKSYAILMEVIDGLSLGKLGARDFPLDAQTVLVGSRLPYAYILSVTL